MIPCKERKMTTTAAERYILSVDQGTTSSRAIAFDERGRSTPVASQPFIIAVTKGLSRHAA
jgi:glycerol kinase